MSADDWPLQSLASGTDIGLLATSDARRSYARRAWRICAGKLFVLIHDDEAMAALTAVQDATVGISRAFPAGAGLTVPRREAEWALAGLARRGARW